MQFPNPPHPLQNHIMRQTTKTLAAIAFFSFFTMLARGQNLTPQELTQIQNNPDFTDITSSLENKGFKLDHNGIVNAAKATEGRWYFSPFTNAVEQISSLLIKSLDSTQKAKTVYFLYNVYQYKDFINSLKNSGHKFDGIQVINDKACSIFKKNRTVFTVIEYRDTDKRAYFEVILKTE